jgi:hypothetical protein
VERLVLSPPKFLPACYLLVAKPCWLAVETLPPITWWSQPAPSTVTWLRSCIPCLGVGQKKFVLHTVLSKLSYKNIYFDFCSYETKQNSRIQLQSRLKRFASSRNRFSRSHRTFICNVRFSRTMVERRARPTMTFGREERKERKNQLDNSASKADVSSSSSF